MTTDEVLEALERERERLFRAVDALGPLASTTPVTEEGWSAKDVLAHLTHWVGQVAFGLGAQLQPPPYLAGVSGRPTGEEWNARAVAHYRDVSLTDLKAELERLIDLVVERARQCDDHEMQATNTVPWASARPLWQFIGGDTFLHWPVHSEAIEQAGSRS